MARKLVPSPSLTRLEIIRISRGVDPRDLDRETGYSRQHILRVRMGESEPTRSCMAAIISALRRLTLEALGPEDVFELLTEESGPWTEVRRDRAAAEISAWIREHDAFATAVTSLSKYPRDEWQQTLRKRAPGPVAPLIRALIFRARVLVQSDPDNALAHLHLALRLTRELAQHDDDTRALLIGRTWLEMANAQRQQGRFIEALTALEAAELQFEGRPFCTNELGQAWLVRGTIAFKRGEFKDAVRHLRRAVNIFSAVSDAVRVAKVRVVEAGIAFELGRFEDAKELWLGTLLPLTAARDRETEAVVWLNLGWCECEIGNATASRDWFTKAVSGFRRLKQPIELARARWGLALVEARHGDRAKGISMLRKVRADLERLRLLTDAAMVGLDIVELILLDPAREDEAFTLCHDLLNLFHHAGANRQAVKAMAHLRESVRARTADPHRVAAIRKLLEAPASRAQGNTQ
jgi:tetratricopeptide (TPR) repeat protein